jgi:hypothetical protein
LVPAAGASAATLHVSPGGSGGRCTAAAPCGSLASAYRAASPGDVVEVAAGSYGSQSVSKDPGKPRGSARVVFRARGAVTMPEFTTRANDVTYVGFRLPTPYGVATVRGGRNVTLARFRAAKPYIWGPESSSGTADTLENVTIKGGNFGPHISCGGGFQITRDGPPRNITIDGARFHDFRVDSSCSSAHLDCLHSFNGIQGLTIRNSRFYRCENFGALINGASDILIENNFFEGGIYGFKLRGDESPSIEVFTNLTIRHNSGDTISLGDGGSNTLTGVLVEGNATREGIDCRSGVAFAGNIAESGGRCRGDFRNVRSLGFADPSSGDFHIPASSPAVDRLSSGPARDIDGNARPQGGRVDVGADEVGKGSRPRRARLRPLLFRVPRRLGASHGRVRVPVVCRARGGRPPARCRGTLTLRRADGGRLLASKRLSVRPGRVARVPVRLRPAARALLRRRGSVRAHLRVVIRGVAASKRVRLGRG